MRHINQPLPAHPRIAIRLINIIVKILETALNSAELADLTSMNTISSVQTAPPFPRIATAAYGNTRLAETSAFSMRLGKLGKTGFLRGKAQLVPWS
jgi:hypothetical protein